MRVEAEERAWEQEHTLSVEEAIQEAMNTSQWTGSRPRTTQAATEPHLPLRKASAHKLRARHGGPQPLFAPSHQQVRGFNPASVEPTPLVANVTASSEHAFAGRDMRRPSKLPLGVRAMRQRPEQYYDNRPSPTGTDGDGDSYRPPSSPLLPPMPSPQPRGVRSSKSFGDGLRGLRQRMSSANQPGSKQSRDMPESLPQRPNMGTHEVRESFRSAMTSNSSFLNASSVNTDRSSLASGNSSQSNFVKVYPDWPKTEEVEGDMSVEDAIGMYADGFESAKQSLETAGKPSFQEHRPSSQPLALAEKPKRPNAWHRRSQSASLLDRVQASPLGALDLPKTISHHKRTSTQIVDGRDISNTETHVDQRPASNNSAIAGVPRDRYGFKKVSHYITVQQYDSWNVQYSEHLQRRRRKWHALMHSYGLSTDAPFRFPPKSDKIKRYVRKGIPPELRGAAWFWYAGGPGRLAKEPGLYMELVEQANTGKLSENDREHIERDLNRTFPDNIRFKPDPTTALDAQAGAGGGKKKRRSVVEPETPIVKSLRRVLQAFAVHNPGIGYCQSLNFIAGLLLLFLDEDEEKTFVLLEVVTSLHLPGTHGIALEGANIDIAVLMSCIRDSLPAIWIKLDDKGGVPAGDPSAAALRLPTVSLATTAWFMSLFVGTLPIESVLRVWDCLFFEGSKTLFRIALAIFKAGEREILAVSDPMEIFQVVQTIPRSMLDINGLMEVCFRRRGGFGHVSQELIERRREERRRDVKAGVAGGEGGVVSKWKGRLRSKTKA